MGYLLDTNILLRGIDQKNPISRVVRAAVKAFQRAGWQMFVALQNLIEFWSVATRPREANGLGMKLTKAKPTATVKWLDCLDPQLSNHAALV